MKLIIKICQRYVIFPAIYQTGIWNVPLVWKFYAVGDYKGHIQK